MTSRNLNDFPLKSMDKLRYADTDRQGHVNNSVFSVFLETGRVEMIYKSNKPILAEGASFVIASLKLDFLKEIIWPGEIHTGSGILKIGNSSITLLQHLYQNETCVAAAVTVIVQIDNKTRKSTPLNEEAKSILRGWQISETT